MGKILETSMPKSLFTLIATKLGDNNHVLKTPTTDNPLFRRQTKKKMAERDVKKRPKDCYIICEKFERKSTSKFCISLAVI